MDPPCDFLQNFICPKHEKPSISYFHIPHICICSISIHIIATLRIPHPPHSDISVTCFFGCKPPSSAAPLLSPSPRCLPPRCCRTGPSGPRSRFPSGRPGPGNPLGGHTHEPLPLHPRLHSWTNGPNNMPVTPHAAPSPTACQRPDGTPPDGPTVTERPDDTRRTDRLTGPHRGSGKACPGARG